jgi:hypothetical protein
VVAAILVALVISRWGGKRSTRETQTGFREMFEARLREGGDRPGNGPKAS